LYLETITIDEQNPLHVFIQPKGRCHGTFVESGSTGFDVIEQEDGTSNIAFSFRVVAKRRGFEDKRLDYCEAAETDSYLYPELREKELRRLDEERARMDEEGRRMEDQRAARMMENDPTGTSIPMFSD
jgi:predicted Zn-dependent peptidase